MRPVPLLAALTLSLLARLSAAATTAAPGIQSAGRVPKLSGRYTEMEPSAMFSQQQLLERPTRANGRRLAARASAKPLQDDHVIEVKKTNGDPIGFLNQYYVLTTNLLEALHLAAPDSSPGDLVFASSSSRNTVGLVVHPFSGNDFMTIGSANSLVLTNSEAITAGSTPTKSENDYNDNYKLQQKGETAVWHYNSDNGGLLPHWTNPDGTDRPIYPVVDDKTYYVYMPGDGNAFRKNKTPNFVNVYFNLILTSKAYQERISELNPFRYTIAAYDADKHHVGYFDKNYGLTTDRSMALAVAIPSPGAFQNLKTASSGRNNVGLVVDPQSDSDSMKARSANSLILTNSEATSKRTAPALMKNDFNDREHLTQNGESAVWQFSARDKSLAIQWFNPDGNGYSMTVLAQDKTGYLSVVADVDAFTKKWPGGYNKVTLKVEVFS